MATDPVCGMYVDERTAELRLVRDGRTYYFCATSCLETFAEPATSARRMGQDLGLAAALSVVVVVLQYGFPGRSSSLAEATLAGIVLVVPGRWFFQGTLDALRSRVANMDVLIAVGTTTAYLYGLAVVLAPGSLPAATYFDASSLIITLLLAGNYLERRTRARANTALRSLATLLPRTAHRLESDGEHEVPVDALSIGDHLRVRAGERIPGDGTVRGGHSEVDEATLTGEPLPVTKSPGSKVFAGSLNGEGAIEVRVDRLGPATFLGQIGEMLIEAESSRVPLRERADRWASIFVPFVLSIAVLAALAWAVFGHAPLPVVILGFVSVAITACPCAFGLATPAAILVGTGRAAEEGILFRGGEALERSSRADLVLMDKTGTLTTGRPVVTAFAAASGEDPSIWLSVAAGMEVASTHPIASAVRAYAEDRSVPPMPVEALRVRPGIGVEGEWRGAPVSIVTDRGNGGSVDAFRDLRGIAASRGASVAVVHSHDRPVAMFLFEDPVRSESAEVVRRLDSDGIAVEILSGDSEAAVAAVARSVGIRAYRFGLRPADKLAILRDRQAAGRVVAMVGDGVNDAPALTAADVGIAMGTGSEVARQSGRILLVRSDLRGVPRSLELARRTVGKVRQNLVWAIGYNLVLLPLAAGALVPWFGFGVYGILPEAGAIAMGLSSTLVLTNSLTLRSAVAPGSRPAPGKPSGVPSGA
ncbi:MAG: heavy metal translocating P-type ATPase [Thermoplasmata archaeon]|nr:heavy metal translocating P-type ATPase [Thermoplasmata archaeon]